MGGVPISSRVSLLPVSLLTRSATRGAIRRRLNLTRARGGLAAMPARLPLDGHHTEYYIRGRDDPSHHTPCP